MSFLDWFEHTPGTSDDEHHTVTVKKGDSLWAIAESITGDGNRWDELADANPALSADKDYVIHPGDVLQVPKSWADGGGA